VTARVRWLSPVPTAPRIPAAATALRTLVSSLVSRSILCHCSTVCCLERVVAQTNMHSVAHFARCSGYGDVELSPAGGAADRRSERAREEDGGGGNHAQLPSWGVYSAGGRAQNTPSQAAPPQRNATSRTRQAAPLTDSLTRRKRAGRREGRAHGGRGADTASVNTRLPPHGSQ